MNIYFQQTQSARANRYHWTLPPLKNIVPYSICFAFIIKAKEAFFKKKADEIISFNMYTVAMDTTTKPFWNFQGTTWLYYKTAWIALLAILSRFPLYMGYFDQIIGITSGRPYITGMIQSHRGIYTNAMVSVTHNLEMWVAKPIRTRDTTNNFKHDETLCKLYTLSCKWLSIIYIYIIYESNVRIALWNKRLLNHGIITDNNGLW